jgi:competence protein ComEC
VYFLNVGQGDAALIITPDGVTALVDGGDRLRGAELVKWLRSMGLQKIDWVMPSHPHADHISGLNAVLEELPVGNALLSGQTHDTQTYRRQLDLLREKAIPVTDAVEGLSIALGERVTATVLNPPRGLLKTSEPDEDNSVVLRVCIAITCMLFTGDLGDGGERSMIARYRDAPDQMKSAVLKVSHHGSAEPNHPDFLALVGPQVALIGAGLSNPFHHPTQKALDRLNATGAAIYCTFVHGTLLVEMTETSHRVQQLRGLAIRPTSGGRVVPAPPLSPEPCHAQ